MKKAILKTLIAVLIFVFSFSLAIFISTQKTTDTMANEKEVSTKASEKEKANTNKNNNKDKNNVNKKEQATAITTNPTELEVSQSATELMQEGVSEVATLLNEAPVENPTLSQEDIDKNNIFNDAISSDSSIEDLNNRNCSQLILVKSFGNNTAQIYFFEKNDNGIWSPVDGLSILGYVGELGVSNQSYEGSRETPAGLFKVGEMFYIGDEKPATGLADYFQVTENTYWVDDPSSKYYNQKVEGTQDKDWNSAEYMIGYYSSYKYGFVIDFNRNPIVPNKGSAIFFHIGYEPTAGCVAVSEDMMLEYLARLNSAKNPYILMQ